MLKEFPTSLHTIAASAPNKVFIPFTLTNVKFINLGDRTSTSLRHNLDLLFRDFYWSTLRVLGMLFAWCDGAALS